MQELSANIRRLAVLMLWGFLLVCLLFGYWQAVRAPGLRANPHNEQARQRENAIKPGCVYTADGEVVLRAERIADEWRPAYPQGAVYCHLTGYNRDTGLQKAMREVLLGIGAYEDWWRTVRYGPGGLDIALTVNSKAQKLATMLMRGKRGSVVALDPRTGAVLAMVSAPAYDPAVVLENKLSYEMFRNDPNSPELNRALQGLYPPGSIFKVFTAAVGLDIGLVEPETIFECSGATRVSGVLVKCRKPSGHGRLTLSWALADSCNVAFAKLAEQIGPAQFRSYLKKFHLLDQSDVSLPASQGKMADFDAYKGERELAQAAFGQGATMVTPLAMARMTATVANGGELIQPYLVAQVKRRDGQILREYSGRSLGQAISQETAGQVAGMMAQAVEKGTASRMALPGYSVAAKTGSAQVMHGEPHAWMVAFAPRQAPRVVVAVVVENGGAGGTVAGPIARELLNTLLAE